MRDGGFFRALIPVVVGEGPGVGGRAGLGGAVHRTLTIIADENRYENLVERWRTFRGSEADGPEGFFPAYRKPL